jgi:hypothetical protein
MNLNGGKNKIKALLFLKEYGKLSKFYLKPQCVENTRYQMLFLHKRLRTTYRKQGGAGIEIRSNN